METTSTDGVDLQNDTTPTEDVPNTGPAEVRAPENAPEERHANPFVVRSKATTGPSRGGRVLLLTTTHAASPHKPSATNQKHQSKKGKSS
jgi:hypothetical protein